jgi:glucose-1-phosphate adenylyltransferase
MNQLNSEFSRHVSRLTRDSLALILAGGRGSRLYELTDWRAKPGLYFGGKYRIIDFPLSNCINSGVRRIGVLTQYKAHSLIRHLVHGWSWFQAGSREFVEILPASQRVGGEWYRGTADAVYQNLDIIRTHTPSYVLVLSGDHVYKMDYGPFLAAHADTKADMTVSCVELPCEEAAGQFGVMTVDETGRVIAFDEKPEDPNPVPGKPGICLASMGNYIFNTEFLYEQVIKDADSPASSHDFGKNIIPSIIKDYRVYAYPFRNPETQQQAYWRDVGTLDAFWEANMELVSVTPQLNLYDQYCSCLTSRNGEAPQYSRWYRVAVLFQVPRSGVPCCSRDARPIHTAASRTLSCYRTPRSARIVVSTAASSMPVPRSRTVLSSAKIMMTTVNEDSASQNPA